MADSGSTGNRDNSAEIDEDDPLMELSRIIGLEPRRENVSRYAPAPRVEPEMDAEALELPAAPEAADVLQADLAEELIASLESDDDFLVDAEVADDFAEPESFEADEHAAAGPLAAEEQVPHIGMAAPEAGSLEAELESILNPPVSRAMPLGLRPLDDEPAAEAARQVVPPEPVEYEGHSSQAWDDSNFEETSEAGDDDAAAAATALDDDFNCLELAAEAEPVPVRAETSDFWRRTSFQAGGGSFASAGYAPVPVAAEAPLEPAPLESELAPEPVAEAAAPAAYSAPEYEPVVDIIAHEPRGVELTDNLDVPEFDYAAEEKPVADAALDEDYDGGYGNAYPSPGVQQAYTPAVASPSARYAEPEYDQIDDAVADLEDERDFGSPGFGEAAGVAAAAAGVSQTQARRGFVLDDDDNFGESLDVPQAPAAAARRSAGRSYLIAAGLGALALLGGIGAYALTRPGGDAQTAAADAPVVLKADAAPVKVAPETPGGKVVPNQDIAVFDKASGSNAPETVQTELVSQTETPVDLAEKSAPRVVLPGPAKADAAPEAAAETAASAPEEAPAKSEERVADQPADDASLVKTEVASVSPKKVRTMVVKADGSLEERAAPAAVASAVIEPVMAAPTESAVPAKKVQTSAVKPEETVGAVAKADAAAPAAPEDIAAAAPEAAAEAPAAVEEKPVVKTVKVKKVTQKAAKAEALREVAAANIPLVDGRPSDQPVTIVAKTGKTPQAAEEVAALAPQPAPASSGSYVIQIASAPSPDAAEATYASLSRKFGSVIGGRNVKIQKADIPGKGTFYRVRIAAGSKKEAAALCARYKSAGGQCLVAR